jgi:hypothetical protein
MSYFFGIGSSSKRSLNLGSSSLSSRVGAPDLNKSLKAFLNPCSNIAF